MTSRLHSLFLAAPLALLSVSCEGEPDEIIEPDPPTISGQIQMFGCQLPDTMIVVEARPLSFGAPDFESEPDDTPAAMASISETSDPALFEFTITDIEADRLYQLQAGVLIEECGKIFWRGPLDGLVPAGSTDLQIEGYAARTTVAIFDRESDEWVGMDQLDFTSVDAGTRELRWKTNLPEVTGGEFQVSLDPFPTEGDFGGCDLPERGLVFRQALDELGGEGWQSIGAVNLSQILVPARAIEAGLDSVPGVNIITEADVQPLLAGAPVYMRVVPNTASGPACNTAESGVHGWVVTGKVPDPTFVIPDPPDPVTLTASGNHFYKAPFLGGGGQGHPTYYEQAYMIVKDHTLPAVCGGLWDLPDPLGCMIVNAGWAAPGSTLTKGSWFYYTPSSGGGGGGGILSKFTSFTAAFGSLVTEAISYAGQAVDYFNKLAQAVKSAVAKFAIAVLDNIPGFTEGCALIAQVGPTCEGLVKAGLEAGLTAMGVPPSVPSWDQLKEEGIEYVAAQLATEVAKQAPIPAEFTEDVFKDMAQMALDEIEKKRSPSSDPKYDWVTPYLGFDPPVWRVSMIHNGPDPIPGGLDLVVKDQALMLGSRVPVPTQFPASGELKIPISMPINTSAIFPPRCVANELSQITCTPSFLLLNPLCEYTRTGVAGQPNEVLPLDCAYTNWVGIYYRDQWMAQVAATPCTDLKASTVRTVDLNWDTIAPDPPYYNVAVVPSQINVEWAGGFHLNSLCTP